MQCPEGTDALLQGANCLDPSCLGQKCYVATFSLWSNFIVIRAPGKRTFWTRVINYACYQLPIARNSAADAESTWFLVRLDGAGVNSTDVRNPSDVSTMPSVVCRPVFFNLYTVTTMFWTPHVRKKIFFHRHISCVQICTLHNGSLKIKR